MFRHESAVLMVATLHALAPILWTAVGVFAGGLLLMAAAEYRKSHRESV